MKIIEVDGKGIGVTTFIESDDVCRVGLIMIQPDYQNRGLATSIISYYISIAKSKRKRIIIKTYKENRARNLYERLGFKLYDTDDTHVHLEIDFRRLL